MNVELATRVRELIRQYPERHNQATWSSDTTVNPINNCGTTACIAGWVAAANGLTVYDVEHHDDGVRRQMDIDLYAGDQLGLDPKQADALFYSDTNEAGLAVLDRLIETNGEATPGELWDVADEVSANAS
jgi:hypothetical protein